MSNFAQYVFSLPKEQKPIVMRLSTSWDKLTKNQRTITQVEMRRTLHLISTDAVVTVQPEHPAYQTIISLGQNSPDHIERFEEMARKAKESKTARRFMASLKAFLAE